MTWIKLLSYLMSKKSLNILKISKISNILYSIQVTLKHFEKLWTVDWLCDKISTIGSEFDWWLRFNSKYSACFLNSCKFKGKLEVNGGLIINAHDF